MHTMNVSGNSSVHRHSLEKLEYSEFIAEYLPIFIYLLILGVIGTFGNLHVLVVYSQRYKPSNHRIFILWLATVDLFSCTISIPFEMYDIRYRYTFTASWACKIFRFLNHAASVSSGFLLGLIALERFRKACQPTKSQMTLKQAKIACIVILLISSFLAVPAVVIYGANVSETFHPGILGSDCTSLSKYKVYFRIYSGSLLLFSTTVFVVCIIIYIFVGKVLYRQMQFRKKAQLRRNKLNALSSFSLSAHCSTTKLANLGSMASLDKVEIEDDPSSLNEHSRVNKYHSGNGEPHIQKRKTKINRSRRITLMFLVATSVSYLGYLPNTVFSVIKALDTVTFNGIAMWLGASVFILLRLYFISNITNPIVYSFMDERFREECCIYYRRLKTLVSRIKNNN
ncbi:cholecystokinin receptor type A-like [Ostrea edulis]|uniref:cholecystokinin receptor type A-like n=1 Tax=Ostrea edulis TaxID=37623 RepID=UPI002095EDA0|nr:cholecystokinin receptor type A-like [Ostrea edulis]XP_048779959.1 cholecystokinin receptor type A-like [Ostrea edulis]